MRVLQWIDSQSPCSHFPCLCAVEAQQGRRGILRWICAACPARVLHGETAEPAATIGMWKAVVAMGSFWDRVVGDNALAQGDLDLVIWARAQDPPCRFSLEEFQRAIGKKHLHVLVFFLTQDTALISPLQILAVAVAERSLETISLCSKQGLQLTSAMLSLSRLKDLAQVGDLDLLKLAAPMLEEYRKQGGIVKLLCMTISRTSTAAFHHSGLKRY